MFIIAIVLIIILIIGISFYNGLIAKRNQVANAFSAIDVMLKKRYDLIPNLVQTIKQYTGYEERVLTQITDLRTKAAAGQLTNQEKIDLDKQMGSAVNGMMVTVENYPDLKANQNFMNLQTTWTESEEQIAAARRNYNSSVTAYNNGIMMFPGSIFAGMLNYQPFPVIENTVEERKNISAKDLFNS
ncbi:LemA family protein [Pedobacter sp. AW31-3R]|uniref:LemA family protein n=1 Tax=Pedobacter sp. AW31-3R TaxID=3445781 RepID=UPI003FA08814